MYINIKIYILYYIELYNIYMYMTRFFFNFLILCYDIIFTNYAASVGRFCPPLNYIRQGRVTLIVSCSSLSHALTFSRFSYLAPPYCLSGSSHTPRSRYFSLAHLRTLLLPPTRHSVNSSGSSSRRQHCGPCPELGRACW